MNQILYGDHRGREYLYFVATDDPAIKIPRVRNRVNLGGHSIPEDFSTTPATARKGGRPGWQKSPRGKGWN